MSDSSLNGADIILKFVQDDFPLVLGFISLLFKHGAGLILLGIQIGVGVLVPLLLLI